MIGPVFALEWLLGSRRGKLDLLCRVYAGWLLVQFIVLASDVDGRGGEPRHVAMGRFINSYIETLVGQHFLLLMLATPTFVAGAVADEKSRRTMDYLLTADLTSWEIVLGKLLGRLAQVGVLSLTALPFLCVVGGYASLPPITILVIASLTLVPFFGIGALSILASVWSRQTRDAVLRVYAWLIVGYIGLRILHAFIQDQVVLPASAGVSSSLDWLIPLDDVLLCLNPVHVLEPAWKSQQFGVLAWRALASMLVWGSIGLIALGLAVWRLRPAYRKELEHPARSWSFLTAHAPCGNEPIAWREREVEGLALMPGLRRVPRWLGMLAILAFNFGLLMFSEGRNPWPVAVASLGMVVAAVIVGVRASGTICSERERQTWEVLMLTPLTNRGIIQQKLRGIMHAFNLYFAVHATSLLVVALAQRFEAAAVVFVMLVFTWVLAYFMAANGLLWSARSTNSWRSLLGTLLTGWLYMMGIYFVSGIGFSFGCCIFGAIARLQALPEFVSVAMMILLFCAVEAGAFYYVAQVRLGHAVRWIANHDRAQHRVFPGDAEERPPELG